MAQFMGGRKNGIEITRSEMENADGGLRIWHAMEVIIKPVRRIFFLHLRPQILWDFYDPQ